MPGISLAGHTADKFAMFADGPLRDVLKRDLPVGADTALDRIAPAAGVRAVYVSAPITTGPAYLDWLITHKDASPADRESARGAMVEANVAAVAPLVRAVPGAFPGAHVIDPTALEEVLGWEQADYHRFWAEVVFRFVDEVVFAEGWICSVGCSVEFALAALCGLPTYDARFEALSPTRGVELLRSTIPRILAAGGAADMQEDVIATLTARES